MDQKQKKILFIFSCFALAFLIILGKSFKIQILDSKKLLEKSKRQVLREQIIYPKRGNIYDRDGSPLAINVQTYSIFTIPKEIERENEEYRKLSKIVPTISYARILKKIKKRKTYTWLARKIELTSVQVKKIKKLKGIYIDSVPKRFYPNKKIASQLLGFVGVDNTGLEGVEYEFDKLLRGQPQKFKYIKDAKGRAVKHSTMLLKQNGENLYLTIDKDIQGVVEDHLAQAVKKYKATKGGIGIMDVETGEVLAMANYPTFDPTNFKKSKQEHRKLSFVTDPIEPGSILKTFTVASVLENKIADINTNFYCEQGVFEVDDHVITEAVPEKKYEWLSVKEILQYSSNIGTTKIAFDLTYSKLKETLESFGIGKKTNIEIPGESRGIFSFNEPVSLLSLSNLSFGQGIATTGIQMLSAYSVIANNGVYVPPTIVKKDEKKDERRVISKKQQKS